MGLQAYGMEGDPDDVFSLAQRLRLVKTAQQRKDIIFDCDKHLKNLTSKQIDVIIHDEMRSSIMESASTRLDQDFSDKTPEELKVPVIIHSRRDALSHRSSSFQQARAGLFRQDPEAIDVIIHDEMRFRIVVAASSRLGTDLSSKTPEELEVIIHDEMCFLHRGSSFQQARPGLVRQDPRGD